MSADICLPSSAWDALLRHRDTAAHFSLRELIDGDAARFERYSVQCAGILFNFSRHLVTEETLGLLMELARERGLGDWIERLFTGDRVNATEKRAALHTALRAQERVLLDGRDVVADVADVLGRMRQYCEAVRSGRRRGATGRAFTDVLNIGIGGSFHGPALAIEALGPYSGNTPRVHFISSADGAHLAGVLGALAPETTLVIVSSKSMRTTETLANARAACGWLAGRLGTAAAGHLAAVTADTAAARALGIEPDAVFEYWDWVGGRYSLCSAAGLPVALAAGMDNFDALRAGAREMDEHFRRTPFARNAPVLAGLLGVWYASFLDAAAHAILPYDERLRRLPEYVQQLEMESNGKRVARDGAALECDTAPVVFGATGTGAQHTFFQMLHQGTRLVPADFIACCRPHHGVAGHHELLIANFLAQTEALARGETAAQAEAGLRRRGMDAAAARQLAPHCALPGNRPSTSILLDRLDPRSLGALIAYYEHRTFVESVVWNINAFDQWGVERGKELAQQLLPQLAGEAPVSVSDAVTRELAARFRSRRREQS
jgi:glucose-6-phosphate isomerase